MPEAPDKEVKWSEAIQMSNMKNGRTRNSMWGWSVQEMLAHLRSNVFQGIFSIQKSYGCGKGLEESEKCCYNQCGSRQHALPLQHTNHNYPICCHNNVSNTNHNCHIWGGFSHRRNCHICHLTFNPSLQFVIPAQLFVQTLKTFVWIQHSLANLRSTLTPAVLRIIIISSDRSSFRYNAPLPIHAG